MQLNPSQAEAIDSSGIQLILAGPGSGKTRVITEKVIHLLESGVDPSAILALTFGEKGAKEMADRIAGRTTGVEVAVHTFHSFCFQVLRDHVLESGIAMQSGLISSTNQLVWGIRKIDSFGFQTIEVGNNAAAIIESMLEAISTFRDEAITPDELAAYLDAKELGDGGGEKDQIGRLRDLLSVYRAYEQYKRAEHLIDYSDMVLEAVRLLQRRPEIREEYRARFPYILIDEFQDTNYVQLQLVRLLAGDHLCVVGDDDQAIYRFRGAYLTNFDDFRRTWSGCCETLLDRNYRSTSTILRLALQLMESAPDRQSKRIETENPEGEPVVVAQCENEEAEVEFIRGEIAEILGTGFLPRGGGALRPFGYRDIAILSRKRDKGVALARALSRQGIPCTFRGDVELFTLPEIRDVMAWLRVVDNPVNNGVALYRLMRSAGIAEVAVQRLTAGARRFRDRDLGDDGISTAMRHAEELVPAEAPLVAELVASIDRFVGEKEVRTLPQLVHALLMHGAGLYRRALGGGGAQSVTALNTFYTIAVEYDEITRDARLPDFLEYLSVMDGLRIDVEVEEKEDAVQVMTVHKAKGLEFPAVFVVDVSERQFPLRYQAKKFMVPDDLARGLKTGHAEKELFLQEERRLLYVAMTRAEERLYLTHLRSRKGNTTESKPSTFLDELDFTHNPLIRVRQVEAPVRDALDPAEVRDPLDLHREAQIDLIARAVGEARYTAAFVHLVTLERIRLLAEGRDPASFDPASYLAVPLPAPGVILPATGKRSTGIPKGFGFSASSLERYDDCPLRFKFEYLLEIPTPPKTYFGLGTAVHTTAELLSKDRLKGIGRSRDEAVAILKACWDSSAYTSRTHEEEDWGKALLQLDNYLGWEASNPNTVVDVERRFAFPYLDQVMRGKIDRLERRPDGELVVIDYKTGKTEYAPSRNRVKDEIQLNLYALAIYSEFGELPAEASYLYLREAKSIPYTPTVATLGAFRERITEIIGNVLAGKFPPRQSYDCRDCDYREICESDASAMRSGTPVVHTVQVPRGSPSPTISG
jgi:DNA helicase II / ATP-dependent DNA helicase PcrA